MAPSFFMMYLTLASGPPSAAERTKAYNHAGEMQLLRPTLSRGGGAAALAAASIFICTCALLTPAAAFVPVGARLPTSQRRTSQRIGRSSCSVHVARGRRSPSRRSCGSSAAFSPLGMMFDTLAENMAGVANLFTGQKTITESRCGSRASTS